MTIDHFLNFVARALLRTCAPTTAHAVLTTVAKVLPKFRTREDIGRADARLRGQGTCLSRALVVAARSPAADVVIGVQRTAESLHAHAWLEVDGKPIHPSDPSGQEIARLRGRYGDGRTP